MNKEADKIEKEYNLKWDEFIKETVKSWKLLIESKEVADD